MSKGTAGIYCIRNKINNKSYVGSSIDIRGRWAVHRGCLKRGNHDNPHLQSAWTLYGSGAFVFEVLEECGIPLLEEREEWWIDYLGARDAQTGYNIRSAINGFRGIPLSEEHRKKIATALTGKIYPPERRANISASLKGKPATFAGRKHTDEAKAKIAARRLGTTMTPEAKSKISASALGREHSEEAKRKISEAKKAYWAARQSAPTMGPE